MFKDELSPHHRLFRNPLLKQINVIWRNHNQDEQITKNLFERSYGDHNKAEGKQY